MFKDEAEKLPRDSKSTGADSYWSNHHEATIISDQDGAGLLSEFLASCHRSDFRGAADGKKWWLSDEQLDKTRKAICWPYNIFTDTKTNHFFSHQVC